MHQVAAGSQNQPSHPGRTRLESPVNCREDAWCSDGPR
jgi:hypothetical protein